MSNLGVLHYFLSLEVKQGSDGIFISQRKYVDPLKRFNTGNFNITARQTPRKRDHTGRCLTSLP